jgi:hypothetical protein
MEKFKKLSKYVAPVATALMPVLAFAQQLPNPTPPISGKAITFGTIMEFVKLAAQYLIIIGVILAVIFIIWGGIIWITAGSSDRAKTGKTTVMNGIFGAGVVLGVGVILQTLAYVVQNSSNPAGLF